ncbi:MAG TPA: pyruvate dehydrogenase complex dihydrolipoamide acetyltransferase, partial [Alphaproteobacteria bacterium]|nr:pyruvate dehydrogenase complex dihydrolipoamide acetyltransferase [Alphaproteobacteria bacterium]
MAIDIFMPALSPTMESGKLSRWLKKVGDKVSAGDVIAEIETDKATMEVEAIDEGVLAAQLVSEGAENVPVNSLIARLAEDGEDLALIEKTAPEAPAAQATLAQATPAQHSGAAPETKPSGNGVVASSNMANPERVKASPLARRIAKTNGLDLSQINGSGPNGRIIKRDVEQAKAPPQQKPTAAIQHGAQTTTQPEIMPLDGMRKTIAARLTEAKQTVPHFYLTIDCRLDDLLTARKNMNAHLDGVKISVNDFIIKAMALALRDVPDANAQWGGDHILKLKQSDVAVAVAIEGGLFTPVIRAAESKGLKEISAEMKALAGLARDRKLTPD